MLTQNKVIFTAQMARISKCKLLRIGSVLLVIASLLSYIPLNVNAQQDPSVKQLKEQVALLTEMQKKPDLPDEVKQINADLLRQRRNQLLAALKSRIDALREYRAAIGTAVTAEANQQIENTIRDLETELKEMTGSAGSSSGNATAMSSMSSMSSVPPAPAPPSNSPVPPPQLAQADCYPDAPPALIQTANDAAQQIVDRNDPTEVTSQFFQILFFTTAHAVSVDAVDASAQERDTINKINLARVRHETKRTDKQVGASARSEGSTTAAEKPGFAELLGFAIEHGAVQKEVNGTTLTLSSSPYAFVVAASGEDTGSTYRNYGYLSRIGVSANFNIDDTNDDVLASARRNQLSEWSVKARITGDRSDRSRSAEEIWQSLSAQFAAPDLVLTAELARQFQTDRSLNAKRREIEDRLLTPAFTVPVNAVLTRANLDRNQKITEIAKLILCEVKVSIFDQVRSGAFRMDSETRKRLIQRTLPAFQAALDAKQTAIENFEKGLNDLSFKPVLTLAYNNKREPMKSDYSVLKLLFQKKSTEGFSIIANAGMSFYHKPNATLNQKDVRDFAAALSFEGNAKSPFMLEGEDESRVTFSFTGRYQRLFENRGRPNVKADIGVAQFKLEVPVLTGVTIPFSVSYATATELIKEDHVRAHFGFTLDTDKVFQILKLRRQ